MVERVSGALGPAADPAKVEAVVSSLLVQTSSPSIFTGGRLHISLADCSSLLTKTVRSRAYDKIRRIASHFESAQRQGGFGSALQIVTTPLTQVAGKATASDLIVLARMLDDAARDCSASGIHGLTVAAERHTGPVAAALLSVLPEILRSTSAVTVDILASAADGGLNVDAVADVVAAARRFTCESDELLRLGLLHAVDMSSPPTDAALYLTADADALMQEIIRDAPEASLHDLADILSATACALGRSAAQHGEAAADLLSARSGLDVHFGGVALNSGPISSTGRTLQAAFAAALARGFRAVVPEVHVLPHRTVTAFATSTEDAGAGARLVDELARSGGRPVVVHALFSEKRAGERIHIGAFHDVIVEECADADWFRRGGYIRGWP